MPKNESLFNLQIVKSIKAQLPDAWVHKNIATPYGNIGLPDIEGIYESIGFVIEGKIIHSVLQHGDKLCSKVDFTPLQILQLEKANYARGVAVGLICVEWQYAIVIPAECCSTAMNEGILRKHKFYIVNKNKDMWEMNWLKELCNCRKARIFNELLPDKIVRKSY